MSGRLTPLQRATLERLARGDPLTQSRVMPLGWWAPAETMEECVPERTFKAMTRRGLIETNPETLRVTATELGLQAIGRQETGS